VPGIFPWISNDLTPEANEIANSIHKSIRQWETKHRMPYRTLGGQFAISIWM